MIETLSNDDLRQRIIDIDSIGCALPDVRYALGVLLASILVTIGACIAIVKLMRHG